MAIELGFTLFKTVFENSVYFNIEWLMSLVLTGLTLLILTRDTQKWAQWAFPVMVMWHIAGISPFIVIYIASAIAFGISTLSLQTISALLNTTTEQGKRLQQAIKRGKSKNKP